MQYAHDTWSVELPDVWEVEETEECVITYHPDGVGAFQISSYFKEDGDVALSDLLEFAEIENPKKVDLPYLSGIFKKVRDEGDTIFNWWLCAGDQLIFATYVCGTEDEAVESEQRDALVQSLRTLAE